VARAHHFKKSSPVRRAAHYEYCPSDGVVRAESTGDVQLLQVVLVAPRRDRRAPRGAVRAIMTESAGRASATVSGPGHARLPAGRIRVRRTGRGADSRVEELEHGGERPRLMVIACIVSDAVGLAPCGGSPRLPPLEPAVERHGRARDAVVDGQWTAWWRQPWTSEVAREEQTRRRGGAGPTAGCWRGRHMAFGPAGVRGGCATAEIRELVGITRGRPVMVRGERSRESYTWYPAPDRVLLETTLVRETERRLGTQNVHFAPGYRSCPWPGGPTLASRSARRIYVMVTRLAGGTSCSRMAAAIWSHHSRRLP